VVEGAVIIARPSSHDGHHRRGRDHHAPARRTIAIARLPAQHGDELFEYATAGGKRALAENAYDMRVND
jgi:hypothetical protein